MSSCNYNKLRKIKDITSRSFFKAYLTDIFLDLANINEEIPTVSKLTFMNFLDLPYFISEKLFKTLNPNDNFLNMKEFVNGLNNLYNGPLREAQLIIFKIFDFDDDNYIIPEDVKLMISFIFCNSNEEKDNIEYMINNFFRGKNKLDFDQFNSNIRKINSDIFFIVIYYILKNSPFEKTNLNLYKLDEDRPKLIYEKFYEEDCIETTAIVETPSNFSIIFPSRRTIDSFKIDIYNIDNDSDEEQDEEDLLFELENTTTDIFNTESIRIKTIRSIENNYCVSQILSFIDEHYKKQESNRNIYKTDFTKHYTSKKSFISADFESHAYKLDQNKGLKEKIWLVVYKKNMFYFNNIDREKIIKLRYLSCSYVKESINEIEFDGKTYYSFEIVRDIGDNDIFYFKEIDECESWISKLKNNLKQRSFRKDYKILYELGKGGFCSVYLIEKLNTKERYAVKIFEKKNKNEKNIEAFKTEIEIQKFCKHENIVKYVDSYEDEENIYLIQEFMNFGNLSELLAKIDTYLEESEIKKIIIQIADAIYYLHSYGIIHRDLKPHNVLVHKNKNNVILKLADFGLSKVMGKNETTKDCLGTLFYASPEVVKSKKYNNKIDLWSMGVILYFMLFKEVPFFDDTKKNVIFKICFEEFKIPKSRKVSDELLHLLRLCLQKDYCDRIDICEFLNHIWIRK